MALRGWPRQLTWADFRKVDSRPPGSREDAHIESEFSNPPGKPFQIVEKGGEFRLSRIVLRVKVDGERTWVVKGAQDEELLRHEQGHFDIIGLLAREWHRTLQKLRANSEEQLKTLMRREERRILAKGEHYDPVSGDGLYDRETDHGQNRGKQKEGNQRPRRLKSSGKPLPAP